MKTVLSTKGQLVLPASLRALDGLEPGESFQVERLEAGSYLLKRIPPGNNHGLVDWLLSCPEKDWFEPLPSESTDTL